MKYILWILTLFGLLGCGGTSKQYLLSIDTEQASGVAKRSVQIGVDKITVPGYLEESRIPTQKRDGEIDYRNEGWAVSTATSLTNSLIHSLQKRFSNPNVYLFPWDVERERGIRVKVVIQRFIYSGDKVILEANYFIKRIGSRHKRSYLFAVEVPSAEDTPSVVHAMGNAFAKLAAEIGGRL